MRGGRSAFGVQRSAFSVQRSAFDGRQPEIARRSGGLMYHRLPACGRTARGDLPPYLCAKWGFSPWLPHRLEAYATLTLRRVERWFITPVVSSHEPTSTTADG